jgi:four helix bundle protein
MRNYRDLQVWSKAHSLTLELYRLSRNFPRDEIYGITAQIRRSASSIGANLAEDCGRQSENEMARFLKISLGSASELDYHLLLAHDLGLLASEQHQNAARELTSIRKMLRSLLSAIEEKGKLKAKAAASS